MAISIESRSSELTGVAPTAQGNAKLQPNEQGGRIRMARFSYTVPAGNEADGNNIALCIVPNGARVLRVFVTFGAMGAGAQLDLGIMGRDLNGFYDAAGTLADDDDLFGAGQDVSAAGELTLADTIAQGYGTELDKDCFLVATVENAAWAAASALIGHVEYVVD